MNTKTKVIVAIVCLALAGVAILFQLGVFDRGPEGAQNTEGFEADLDTAEQTPEGGIIVTPEQGGGRGAYIPPNARNRGDN